MIWLALSWLFAVVNNAQKGLKGEAGTAENAVKGVVEPDLKMIRGQVSAAGAVLFGEGFTSSLLSEGLYLVQFTVPFIAGKEPAIAVIPENGVNIRLAVIKNATNAFVEIKIATTAGAEANSNFHFIAVGPHV